MTNKRNFGIMAAGLGLTALIGGVAVHAAGGGKADPAPTGKITPWAAMKIATGKVPGRVLNANFELAEGKWVYGVMIVSKGKIQEVEIDPVSGKIGDTEEIIPEGEAKEIQAELNSALSGKPAPAEKDEKKP